MKKVAKFYKVSKEQFVEGYMDSLKTKDRQKAQEAYENLKLPRRATTGSAGYDFYLTCDICLKPGETIKIPTGIRAKMLEDWVLLLMPRSGLGFKYRLQLNNTVGVIDSDYFNSDNEGHIFARITNDSNEGKTLELKEGEAFMQGLFMPYGIVEDDDADGIRNGGMGSTSK